MIYAFDTHYFDTKAHTACLGFEEWQQAAPSCTFTECIDEPSAYESGSFYKRELPCILSLLQQIKPTQHDLIIVDGFVVLDDDGKLGLGGYLYNELNKSIPIIGVAKNNFATLNTQKRAILRGESIKPLYITALGIDLDEAAELVRGMHGDYRMPTLLKEVDGVCRDV